MKPGAGSTVPVYVLGTSGCNSLGVARCFGRRGLPVWIFDDRPSRLHRGSRYGRVVQCPDLDPADPAAASFIRDHAHGLDERPVLISTSDRAAMYELANRDVLDDAVRFTASDQSISQRLIRKDLFYKAAAEAGVAHPRTYQPTSLAEALAAGEQVGYPALVKPALSHSFLGVFGLKCMVARDANMMRNIWGRIEPAKLSVLVQDLIPGHRIYMWYGYYDRDSRLVASMGYHKLRQYPPNVGSGALVEAFDDAALIEEGDRLLQHVKYRGIVEPEFKYDPRDGTWKILEINARTSTQNRLPASVGRDMEYLAYCEAVGMPMKPSTASEVRDGRRVWTESDCDLASTILDPEVSWRQWWRDRRARKVYAHFAWDDPVPAVLHLGKAGRIVASASMKRYLPSVYRLARREPRGSDRNVELVVG